MSYSEAQTVFYLAMVSNLAIGRTGSAPELEHYLAGRIDAHLADAAADIGAWTRVWGPAVFEMAGSRVASNVMYVARRTSGPRYVVAVAGTNFNSVFDVLVEDLFVSAQVPWTFGRPPAGAALSAATSAGLRVLQSLAPKSDPGADLTLPEFLKTILTEPIDVTVAGHSLGGALAPMLALWLLDTQADWDPGARAAIACEPIAGPTPGNGALARHYDERLGARTTRLFNALDIVPHAWSQPDLAALPSLYEPEIPAGLIVGGLAAVGRAMAAGQDYTQLLAGTRALAGVVDRRLVDPGRSGVANYLVQGLHQHINAYFSLLNVAASAELLNALTGGMGEGGADALAASLRATLARFVAVPGLW